MKARSVLQTKGFSLVEVLLMVSLFAIILSSAMSVVADRTPEESLNAKTEQVVNLISQAHDYSMTGYQEDVWSIKVLDNDASCEDNGDCVALFRSRDWSTRDSSYDRYVQLDAGNYIDSDQENEFGFGYMSGWLTVGTTTTSTQSIVLNNAVGDTRTVWVFPSGLSTSYYCGDNTCNIETEDCSSCHSDCGICANTPPVISDIGRAPLNGAVNVPETGVIWSWTDWSDSDGDTVEYYVNIYHNWGCVGGVVDTFGWSQNNGFGPSLDYLTKYSWQVKGRSQGMTPTDETDFNTCYNLTTRAEF